MVNTKKLEAIARFTANGDVEICGKTESLQNLSDLLVSNAMPLMLETIISSDDPRPYQGYVRKIMIESSQGPIKIELKENDLVITGEREYLEALSEDIGYLINIDNQESGVDEHLHVEYHSDHPYLSSSSAALVVRRC